MLELEGHLEDRAFDDELLAIAQDLLGQQVLVHKHVEENDHALRLEGPTVARRRRKNRSRNSCTPPPRETSTLPSNWRTRQSPTEAQKEKFMKLTLNSSSNSGMTLENRKTKSWNVSTSVRPRLDIDHGRLDVQNLTPEMAKYLVEDLGEL